MPSKLNEKMQKMPFAKMLYPAITVFFIVIVLFLFSKAIIFLSSNINKVFSENTESLQEDVPQFNQTNYALIQKRFNWPAAGTTQIVAPTSTPETAASTTATSTIRN
jgi:hypothetical protein